MEKYFALMFEKGATVENPSAIFREVDEKNSYRLDYLGADGKWVLDMSLLSYLAQGEDGAEEINPKAVKETIGRFLEARRAKKNER